MTRILLTLTMLFALGGCYQSHELGGGGGTDAAPADLCTRTGGHIGTNCGAWHCTPSPLACIGTTCICPGTTMVWDETRGCVVSPMCTPVHAG